MKKGQIYSTQPSELDWSFGSEGSITAWDSRGEEVLKVKLFLPGVNLQPEFIERLKRALLDAYRGGYHQGYRNGDLERMEEVRNAIGVYKS